MRYFFHVQDGRYIADHIGTDLADIAAVRDEAVSASSALLRGLGRDDFWKGDDWSMHVTDEAGLEVLVLRFSAENLGG